jgi:hypothetical protein
MSAMGYGASIYIFVYMFSLIMVYWICVPGRQQLMLLIKKNYQSEVKTQ